MRATLDGMDFGVDGVGVGHWTDPVGLTGCTVVELPAGSIASAEVRGGAPASRELDILAPGMTVAAVDAVLLTGGSVFGLAAADGVVRHLAERGRGVPTAAGPIPIVPTLALFDLDSGDPAARPTAESGYLAAAAAAAVASSAAASGAASAPAASAAPAPAACASVAALAAASVTAGARASVEPVLFGNVGAGTGAGIGKWRGPDQRRPGGLGHAVRRAGPLVVAALCAVNAHGDIDHGDGLASLDAAVADWRPLTLAGDRQNTTIGVVVTNARLDKAACLLVAQGAHDGLARAIIPPHTRVDGDAFIAAATAQTDADIDLVRLLALAAVTEAIRSVTPPPMS